jgi:hypothetical protein
MLKCNVNIIGSLPGARRAASNPAIRLSFAAMAAKTPASLAHFLLAFLIAAWHLGSLRHNCARLGTWVRCVITGRVLALGFVAS